MASRSHRAEPLRVLHAPTDVGGHAYGLSRAERELGLRSDVAVFVAGPYGYGADFRFDVADRSLPRRFAIRAGFLARALRDYDVFHFNFGQSLLALRVAGLVLNELPLLKRAGKTILVTYQGCDVRPQACCFCRLPDCVRGDPYRPVAAAQFARYADRTFHLNPDLAQWLSASRFLPYASVDPRQVFAAGVPIVRSGALRVVHAPSNRDVKGTDHVLAAVGQLNAEGVAVELDLVENVPRTEVLRRLSGAHVAVDQLLLGWYGGFAVEAMALARPVLCFIREDTPADNPFGDTLPIIRCTKDTLTDRLRELAADRDCLTDIGERSRAFVERHHDPRRVAEDVLQGLSPGVASRA